MTQDHGFYISYLLRLWFENDEMNRRAGHSEGAWRASLEDPHTQEMRIFERLADLFAFLERETIPATQQSAAGPGMDSQHHRTNASSEGESDREYDKK